MTPQEEIELLMNEGISLARHMLSTLGEFYPFGRALTVSREVQWLHLTDGSERPTPQSVIELLIQAFHQGARTGTYTAVALFCDVRVTDPLTGRKSDAVQIGLEHQLGDCINTILPYTLGPGRVTFGQPFGTAREAVVFKPL